MSIRYSYKEYPVVQGDVRFASGTTFEWVPLLNVSILYKHAQSKRFEAMVDSGSPTCLFHSSIGKAIGIKIEDGKEGQLGGVIGGEIRKVYYHPIKLCIASNMISVVAGFSDSLSVAAILGRAGFFDNYSVTFDPCGTPPGLDLERINRA